MLRLGSNALRDGKPQEALEFVNQILKQSPYQEQALALRAIALDKLKRHSQAREVAKQCLERYPGNTLALDVLRRIGHVKPSDTDVTISSRDGFARGDIIQGRWEIRDWAEGGMGRVYFVQDREWDDMELAMKSLLLKSGSPQENSTVKQLFLRETKVWLDLGAHPHIVSGYYTLEIEGAPRFFMEYVPGTDLARIHHDAKGDLPLARILDYAIQLAAGMEYVHTIGVIHRDLKPQNCLVTDGDTLRITDFGLGKTLMQADVGTLMPSTSSQLRENELESRAAGTPVYMAPEQWRGLGAASKAADVYAFGTMLYELIAGMPPFVAKAASWLRYCERVPPSVAEQLRSPDLDPHLSLRLLHEAAEPFGLRDIGARVPAVLDKWVLRCLAKRPSDRPTFSRLRSTMHDLYRFVLGRDYPREITGALERTEAGENNRAVSYHVMGDSRRAQRILDRWLKARPMALYPWLNRATIAMNTGEREAGSIAHDWMSEIQAAHPLNFARDPRVLAFTNRLRSWYCHVGSPVLAIAVASGDTKVAIGTADRKVHLWDTVRSELTHTLCGHRGRVSAIALSRDSSELVTGSWDHTVCRWNAVTGERLQTLRGHKDWVVALAIHPDGEYIATGSADGTCAIWRRGRSQPSTVLNEHRGCVSSLDWSSDGRLLVTGSHDGTVRFWRVNAGRAKPTTMSTIEPGCGPVVSVDFAHEDRWIVIGACDGILSTWDTGTGSAIWDVDLGSRLHAAALRDDGSMLAAVCDDGTIHSFDLQGGKRIRRQIVHKGPVRSIRFCNTQAALFTGGDDETLRKLDLHSRRSQHEGDNLSWPLAICRPLSAGEQLSLQQRCDVLIKRVENSDIAAHHQLREFRSEAAELEQAPHILNALVGMGMRCGVRGKFRDRWTAWKTDFRQPIQSASISADGRTIALGMRSGVVALVAADSGERTGTILVDNDRNAPVKGAEIAFIPGSSRVLVASTDSYLRFLDTNGRRVADPWAYDSGVKKVACHPDGERIATAYKDGVVAIWHKSTHTGRWQAHKGVVTEMAFVEFPNHHCLLITTGRDGRACLWNPDTGSIIHIIESTSGAIEGGALSPDRRLIAVRTRKAAAELLEVASNQYLRSFAGHTCISGKCVFSPDGRILATGSSDYTERIVRLWDVRTGAQLHEFSDLGAAVTELFFTPDGTSLITADSTGSVHRWILDFDWGFADVVVKEAHALVIDDAPTSLWPRAQQGPIDVEVLLNIWADVRRSCNHPNWNDETPTVDQLRRAIAAKLAASHERDRSVLQHLTQLVDPKLGHEFRLAWEHSNGPEYGDEESLNTWQDDGHQTIDIMANSTQREEIKTVKSSVMDTRIDGGVGRVSAHAWRHKIPIAISRKATAACYSPNGQQIAVATADRWIVVFDARSGQEIRRFGQHRGRVVGLAWSCYDQHPDDERLASASLDRKIRLWAPKTGLCTATIATGGSAPTCIAFAGDSSRLLIGTRQVAVKRWQIATGLEGKLEGHTDAVSAVACRNHHAVTGSHDSTLRLWNLANSTCKRVLRGHSGPVLTVALDAAGERLISGSDDETARLWRIDRNTPQCIFRHRAPVTAVAWHPSGMMGATADEAGTIKLWDLTTEKMIDEFEMPRIAAITFAPVGDALFIAGKDAAIWKPR